MCAALAELERERVLECQREGIEIAKAEGKYAGRKRLDFDDTQLRKVCAVGESVRLRQRRR